jgi:hypothetical protein
MSASGGSPAGGTSPESGPMQESGRMDETLASELVRVQRQLEAIYQLEPTPAIAPFVQIESGDAREQLIVRQSIDMLELVVLLPETSVSALLDGGNDLDMDAYLGAIEGISHFIHLAERARTRLPTTLLELELQAEVDKFAILAEDLAEPRAADLYGLHRQLYENVRFLHAAASERGRRYRLANGLAAKLWLQLLRRDLDHEVPSMLRRFYRAGQAEKIRMATAA